MTKPYVKLDKDNAAVLLVDHQAGLLSLALLAFSAWWLIDRLSGDGINSATLYQNFWMWFVELVIVAIIIGAVDAFIADDFTVGTFVMAIALVVVLAFTASADVVARVRVCSPQPPRRRWRTP